MTNSIEFVCPDAENHGRRRDCVVLGCGWMEETVAPPPSTREAQLEAELARLHSRMRVLRTIVPTWWYEAKPGELMQAARDVVQGIDSLLELLPDTDRGAE